MVTIVTSAVNLDVKLDGSQQSTLKLDGGQIKNPTKMNYKNNWLATQIIFAYRCFKYFYMFQFLCMFHFLWKVYAS